MRLPLSTCAGQVWGQMRRGKRNSNSTHLICSASMTLSVCHLVCHYACWCTCLLLCCLISVLSICLISVLSICLRVTLCLDGWLSVCLCLSLPVCLSMSMYLLAGSPLSLSLYIYIYIYPSLYIYVSLFLSLLPISVILSVSLFMSCPLSHFIPLSLCLLFDTCLCEGRDFGFHIHTQCPQLAYISHYYSLCLSIHLSLHPLWFILYVSVWVKGCFSAFCFWHISFYQSFSFSWY